MTQVQPKRIRSAILALTVACGLAPASLEAQGRLIGVVYDSVAAKPLASALVQMALVSNPSVSRSARTDPQGRFRLDSVPAGAWVVAVMHPRLEALGIEQLMRTVSTSGGWEQRITLAVPSVRSLVQQVCGDEVASDTTGYLHGRLRSLAGVAKTGTGQIDLQWVDLALDVTQGVGVRRIPRRQSVATQDDGSYTACGLPPGGTVRIRGIRGTDSTGVVELVVPENGIVRGDLAVGPVSHVAVPTVVSDSTADSVSVSEWRRSGTGELRGRVVGPGNVPLPNATIVVRGAAGTARTDSGGQWLLRQLPQGTHTVEMRALGYRAEQVLVDIGDPSVEWLETSLDRVVALDTVRTRALRETMFVPELRAFEQRRKQFPGYYRGPAELDQIMPIEAADIFRSMPGIRIEYGRDGAAVLMRGKAGFPCVPDVYVDRMRIMPDMSRGMIDEWVYARSIRAVEVYPGLTSPPPEFTRVLNDCGAIVIWTGRN